jgi:arylsulfatase A-like enzyme
MCKTTFVFGLLLIGSAMESPAGKMVAFDARTHVSTVSPSLNADAVLDSAAPRVSSSSQSGYTGPDVYGALNRKGKGVWNVGNSGASGLRVRLHNSIGGEVNGLFLFALEGARFDAQNDLLHAEEIFTSQIQRLKSASIRFVIAEGGQFFISEPSENFVTGGTGNQKDSFALHALSAQWFKYDPESSTAGVSTIGAPAVPRFSDIGFAGFTLFAEGPADGPANKGVNFGVRVFSVTGVGPAAASTAAVPALSEPKQDSIVLPLPVVRQKKFGNLNIITIICDDLNDSVEGMGGHPQAKTPNIDRLMKRGVRFSNAASNVPICGPSRASMWSGLHPITTGFYGSDQQNNRWHDNPVIKESTTLFELFTRHGYRNFATGKIQHNGHEIMSIYQNEDGFPGYGSAPNFGPLPNDGNPDHRRHGVLPPWFSENMREVGGWGDGFGPIQDLQPYGSEYGWTMFYSGAPWEFRSGHDRDPMPDEVHAAEAVEFLGNAHDKPFILTVGFTRPHSPWYAPQEYFDLFPLESVELTPILEGDTEDCSKILTQQHDIAQPWGWQKYRKIMENGGEEQLRKWTQAYLACVAFVDAQVGAILDALETGPYADNTLVILTSDHGYHMGEKEYLFKYSPWEESVRMPLVIAGPGVAKNQECTVPVSLVDIYPTLVDYAELAPFHKLDGHSLRPLLENPGDGKWGGPSFSLAASASKVPVVKDTPARAADQHFSLRTERYRYIRCRNGEEELYDHQKDPNEWVNEASNPACKSVLVTLRAQLSEALR